MLGPFTSVAVRAGHMSVWNIPAHACGSRRGRHPALHVVCGGWKGRVRQATDRFVSFQPRCTGHIGTRRGTNEIGER